MPFSILSTTSYPFLLKVPLLLSTAICTYHGMTPPTQPPPSAEQSRFANSDFLSANPFIQLKITAIVKTALCGAALIEAVTLLAQQFPSSPTCQELVLRLYPSALHSPPLLSTYISAAGCILGTAGGGLRIWCHRELGRLFTWQVAVRDDHQLITTGPYAHVQHPSYTGWALMAIGNTLLVMSKGSYVMESGIWQSPYGKAATGVTIAFVNWVTWSLFTRMRKESDVLHGQFGADWEAYSKRTPYWLIPYVY